MTLSIVKIDKCPICKKNSHLSTLISKPFSDQRLLSLLIDRYDGNLTRNDVGGYSFELVYCSECNHIFQACVPSEHLVKKIYTYPQSRIAESLRKRTHAKVKYYIKNARLVEIMGFLIGTTIPQEKNIFDFGMGWGSYLFMAKAYGYNVCGLEVSKERTEFAVEMGIPCVASLAALGDRKFDFIHSDQTLEHLNYPLETLREIAHYLKPDGVVFLSVPNGSWTLEQIKRGGYDLFRKITYPLEHVNCFSHSSLVKMADIAGLKPMPPYMLFFKLVRNISIKDNLYILQYLIRMMFRLRKSTDLYFIKK